jgi:hypothetical protein
VQGVERKIADHNGRLVKTTGDGLLIEFASVVDAVLYALDMQQAMAARNGDVAAYDHVMRAKIHHHNGTREDNAFAQEMIEKAVVLDPQYAHAWA